MNNLNKPNFTGNVVESAPMVNTTPQPEVKPKMVETGAAWDKLTKRGTILKLRMKFTREELQTMLSLNTDIVEKRYVLFSNDKKTQENHPSWRVYFDN